MGLSKFETALEKQKPVPAPAEAGQRRGKSKAQTKPLYVEIPVAAHRALREMAFQSDTTVADIVRTGLRMYGKSKGLKTLEKALDG